MDDMEMAQFLYEFVTDKLNLPAERDGIKPETPLGIDGLQLESLAIVELSVLLEQRFGIAVPDEDLDRMSRFTVAELAAYVGGKRVTA